jgi:hypothetical protein
MAVQKEQHICIKISFQPGVLQWRHRRQNWIYPCDPETEQQSFQSKKPFSPFLMKARLVTVFDFEGIVHQEFVPPGQVCCKHLEEWHNQA